MKIAIFHDYIGAIGGGEKLVLTLARGLGADVITSDVDEDSVRKMGFEGVNIIGIGGTVKMLPLKQKHKPIFLANQQNSSAISAGAEPRPHVGAALRRRFQRDI